MTRSESKRRSRWQPSAYDPLGGACRQYVLDHGHDLGAGHRVARMLRPLTSTLGANSPGTATASYTSAPAEQNAKHETKEARDHQSEDWLLAHKLAHLIGRLTASLRNHVAGLSSCGVS